MTVTADVNALTGLRFDATRVTAAIAAAGNIIGGHSDYTFTEDASEVVDSAVTIMASNILLQGRNIRNLSENTSEYQLTELFTPEIKRLLASFKNTSQTYYVDISPEQRTSTEGWRT